MGKVEGEEDEQEEEKIYRTQIKWKERKKIRLRQLLKTEEMKDEPEENRKDTSLQSGQRTQTSSKTVSPIIFSLVQ